MTSERTRRRFVDRLEKNGVSNTRVLAAMDSIPRHVFVDEALAHRAYEDSALPIGFNQTISQPLVVGLMTQLLLEANPGRWYATNPRGTLTKIIRNRKEGESKFNAIPPEAATAKKIFTCFLSDGTQTDRKCIIR